ncbi:MAG: RNA polymerase sigma factor [Ruminococcus sp.]|uniref:RNA polymerase sigma factor n=1 Tax=Ruminococcus sp. TaxID=41978 RepID=UPI0025DC67BF|nr:RNA polymerase sigma factor [Ruminococcus sp.]MCR5601925.1 RNA polymerase sigma factor [Ruminococcus sp.]
MNDSSALYAFNKFGDTVLRAAFAMTGNYTEAEDITQEVFLTLHASPQNFESDEHMKAWLLRAAINRCKNLRKSARIIRNFPFDDALANTLSCEFTPRDDEIREMIANLPEKYSSVIFLYYFEEYTIKEIASLLGKKENTVSSLLQRGRNKLKTELEKEGYVYET